MSKLIDDLIKEHKNGPFNDMGKYNHYLSKPLPFYSIGAFLSRFKDALRVILDESRAYHYKEDEING